MKYDVFISYRREGGYDTAKHLNDLLVRDGYRVSFDIDTLRNGDFDVQLLERIEECKDFILVVDKHAFDRTLDPDFDPQKDWLRCELAHALKHNKNIIPVFLSGVSGFPSGLPKDIVEVTSKNGPQYNKFYFNEFYKQLKSRFIKSMSLKKKICFTLPIIFLIICFVVGFCISRQQTVAYIDPALPATTSFEQLDNFIDECLDSINELGHQREDWRRQAKKEDVDAQFNLGCFYFEEEKYNAAIKWFKKAEEQGHIKSQYILGVCYDQAIGVKEDLVKAFDYYEQAAAQGFAPAQNDYGIALSSKGQFVDSFNWIKKAAEQGYAPAQYHLAFCYQNAWGTRQNIDESYYWLRKASAQDYIFATICLATWFYLNDNQYYYCDYEEGARILTELADRDNVYALYYLGLCYRWGKGVDQDINKSIELVKQSADLGYAGAQVDIANGYLNPDPELGIEQDFSNAMIYLKMAANQGYPIAMYLIGEMYKNGFGVDKDLNEAEKWFKKASDQGFTSQTYQQMQQMRQQRFQNE